MRNGCVYIIWLIMGVTNALHAQRSYTNTSVLASGNWYKISVREAGIYKIDAVFLNKLGISTSNLSSSSIRLYGNGGAMLPEACNGAKEDDLAENAIQLVDGGDGLFNGNDYFLFYAGGPDTWTKDSAAQRFRHHKNLYSNQSYYFISIGGTGKRIPSQAASPAANTTVTSFSDRYFHELDTVNLLNGSKDWYGEDLQAPSGSQAFTIAMPNMVSTEPGILVSACVARSVNSSATIKASINGRSVLQHDIAGVGGSNLDLFANASVQAAAFAGSSNLQLTYNFSAGGSAAQGWIDWFEVFCRSNLAMVNSQQLMFRDWNSVGAGRVAGFSLQNAATASIWDVSNATSPVQMKTSSNGQALFFSNDAAALHEYIAFSGNFLTPVAMGKTAIQNLHASQRADLIIITYPAFEQQAQRIASFHQQHDQLTTVIASTEQVYNEFSSGTPDPTAIRDFVKMYYDRAGADSSLRPKYLLLLGDASYDYKDRLKNNSNYVPAYENSLSLDPLASYTSDDFFGFLDDNEDINATVITNLLDIGIGRIPAQTTDQANAFVDKLINYTDPKSLGAWRNEQTFIADDQDQNLHLNDAEVITTAAAATNPLFVQNKIYLDAYTQTSTAAGGRYPDVNQAINEQVQNGTLIWNYNGHGSSSRLAEEVVLEKTIADSWTNTYRLPMFITATCDFAPYDNPAINSLGENILLREKTGAIALMTTTRAVFAFSNRIMNRNYLQAALQPRTDGRYPSLGEAIRQAKNITYQTQADITNNRKFTLLGDPALTLAYPTYRVNTSTINGKSVTAIPDTLKALQQYTIGGNVTDVQGNNTLTGFNGTVYASLFDKEQTVSTRANDPDSYQQAFKIQQAPLAKAKAKVVNGQFTCSFVIPQDINYQLGNARISYYADNGQEDANGNFTGVLIGGSQGVSADKTGPVIKAYLNDDKFADGNTVSQSSVLIINLSDASGINIAGTAIGHDITAMVDTDPSQVYVMNRFFQPETDSYQNGTVNFQLPVLSEGSHTIIIKAWDAANNSNTVSIRFRVVKQGLIISDLINYPNPFTTQTSFRFQHNRPNKDLKVTIAIYTTAGKLVKTINETINTSGNRSNDIEWQGRQDNEGKLAPGVYIYQLQVTSVTDGETALKSAKLVLL